MNSRWRFTEKTGYYLMDQVPLFVRSIGPATIFVSGPYGSDIIVNDSDSASLVKAKLTNALNSLSHLISRTEFPDSKRLR